MKALLIGIPLAALALANVAAYFTHIIFLIAALASNAAVSLGYGMLLFLGLICPPVGIIHGFGIWFGAW